MISIPSGHRRSWRTWLAGVAIFAAVLAAAVPANAGESVAVDTGAALPSGEYTSTWGGYPQSQTFVAGASGSLTRVSVLMNKRADVGDCATYPWTPLTVELHPAAADNSSIDFGTVLATTEVAPSAVPCTQNARGDGNPPVEITFAQPEAVTEGGHYALTFQSSSHAYQLALGRDSYADGAAWAGDRLLHPSLAYDLVLQGYVDGVAAGQPDQEAAIGPEGYYTVLPPTANQLVAQTFTAGSTGSVDRVDVYLQYRSFATSGPVTIEVQTIDGSGLPSGTTIGTGTAPQAFAAYTFGWASVPLTQPAGVTAGGTYAIVAHGSDYVWNLSCHAACLGGHADYPGGQGFVRDQYGNWINQWYLDYAFRTFVSQTPADTTAPAIVPAVEGTLGENGWYRSDVTLQWSLTENESPASLAASGCVDQTITADQAATTYSCSATSDGGSAGPVDVTVKRDASAPSIECGTNPTGWQAANVTLSCAASDVGPSGLAISDDGSFQLSTGVDEGQETSTATTPARTVTDLAGNEATVGPFSFSVDRKAPSVKVRPAGDGCTLPGEGGWCRGVQSAGFSAADGGSGLSSDGAASREFATQNASEGSAVMISSGAVEDLVGNANGGVSAGPFKIDSGAPTIVCPSPDPVFVLGQAGATVTATVSDPVSGPAEAAVSGGADTSSVGSKSVALTGSDVAGNSTVASCGYSVIYEWAGFFSPVDNPDVWNVAKAGRAIPVKFSLAGDQGLDILAAGSPSSIQVACPSSSLTDAIEETTTDSTSGLKYNPLEGQYIYVWKTSSWAGTCRRLNVRLVDGTVHFALFGFTK
jgi:hypothetical protein